MNKLKLNTTLIFLVLFLASCAYNTSFVKVSYDALAVSQTSYNTSMKVAVDLYKQGVFGEETKGKILESAGIYHIAHNTAVRALAMYEESRSSTDMELTEKQIALASEALISLLSIIKPYLEK